MKVPSIDLCLFCSGELREVYLLQGIPLLTQSP